MNGREDKGKKYYYIGTALHANSLNIDRHARETGYPAPDAGLPMGV